MSGAGKPLDPEEQELLQEIMNIAFGKAAADLAEVVDLFLVLSVPEVRLVQASELGGLLASAAEEHGRVCLVEQAFWGGFQGSGYLILPSGASRELMSILGNTGMDTSGIPTEELEKGTLLEVGNILLGACVGKLADLLEDRVTYSPPFVALECSPSDALPSDLWGADRTAIVLRTLFRFSGRNVAGHIFLVTGPDSIQWLHKALADFLGRYA